MLGRAPGSLIVSAIVLAVGCGARRAPTPVVIGPAPPVSPPPAAAQGCTPPNVRTRAAGCVRLTALALGESFACALSEDGRILCWGGNAEGELGIGLGRPLSGPALVVGIDDAVEIHAKAHRACARTRRGRILCWGSNYFGQCDANRTLSELPPDRSPIASDETNPEFMIKNMRFAPSPVELPAPALTFALGYEHNCAILDGGNVACWGRNADGAFGAGPSGAFLKRVFTPPARFVEIAAGAFHTCARSAEGEVWCWGANQLGQLGDAGAGGEIRRLKDPTGVTALGLNGNRSCARTAQGEFVCFGEGPDCSGDGKSHPPSVDQSLGRALELSLGSCHYCVVRADRSVDCWNTFARPVGALPERMQLPPVQSMASGVDSSCALLVDGDVMCWGSNYNGEAGVGDAIGTYRTFAPTRVDWLSDYGG
jgi:alpha-tubulin suppressor-like RCC1 family protein